ncbi:hypothetical protein, partial [Pseudomonas aeruginosa]|uniref:hypothetical protein n=1 Tax=Pseudomonas aeruginosa TaxID=287 RepID=UPI001BD57386
VSYYTRVAEQQGAKGVEVINMVVVDLEMLNHPEAGDPKDRSARTGWTPEKPVLHRTPILVVNGLAEAPNGKKLNTLEVDE